jgi:hypothetical protein
MVENRSMEYEWGEKRNEQGTRHICGKEDNWNHTWRCEDTKILTDVSERQCRNQYWERSRCFCVGGAMLVLMSE